MDKSEIKEKIIEYLTSKGCALRSQISKFLELNDTRYVTVPLNELLEEKTVLKIQYKRFQFYVLTRNELEIKRKISNTKQFILESIQHFGPIRAKALANTIKENYDFEISRRLIYRMAKELLLENKIEAKKIALSNIYYEKGNQNQKIVALNLVKINDLKKKTSNLKNLCQDFTNELIDNHVLIEEEITILKTIFSKIQGILYDIDCMGRNHNDLIHVAYILQLKKEIFFILKKKPKNYAELKPLLNLYDIITGLYLKRFEGINFKTYKYFINAILNDKRFCNQKDTKVILNTPSHLLKMEHLLNAFNLESDINERILRFIEEDLVTLGYAIDGKDIKGVLGGILYFFSRTYHLGIIQKKISGQLGTSEVTIRTRYRELLDLYSVKTPDKKDIQEKPAPVTDKVEIIDEGEKSKQDYPKSYRITKITDFIYHNFEEGN